MFVAQHGEDKWMSDNWELLGLKEGGVFVDVGAANGIHCSNTYWLEKTKNFRGILIEPDDRHHEELLRLRCNDNLFGNYVVFSAIGKETKKFTKSYSSYLSGFLRLDGDKVDIAVCKLDDLLIECGINSVDVLSVDTEGTELEVLDTINLEKYKIKVVIIEWDTIGINDRSNEIISYMNNRGYKLLEKLGGNLIFSFKL